MNGMIRNDLPKFVDINNVPKGYYEDFDPLSDRVPCNIDFKKLSKYLKDNNCKIKDISKEQFDKYISI